MDKSFVTETPDELLSNAERDILTIEVLFPKKYYPEDLMYNIICFHATMAVEKILKSYIIINGKNIEKTHDLDYLCESAAHIDSSFAELINDNRLLNTFIPKIKYSSKIPITKQDIDKIIKSLNNICNFPPIKAIRNSFNQKHQYRIIDEDTDIPQINQ
jgi:HEPN domain-containing protein